MEMILRHIPKRLYYIYKVGNTLLLLKASGKKNVHLPVDKRVVLLLFYLRHAVVYNRWNGAVFPVVTFQHRLRYCDIGIVPLVKLLHLPSKALQSRPQTGVVYSPYNPATLLQPWKYPEESPQTHVGSFRVGMNDIGLKPKPNHEET